MQQLCYMLKGCLYYLLVRVYFSQVPQQLCMACAAHSQVHSKITSHVQIPFLPRQRKRAGETGSDTAKVLSLCNLFPGQHQSSRGSEHDPTSVA